MHVRLRHLAPAVLVALLAARPAAAQEVTGRVLDGTSDAPVQSALVVLLDLDGQRVARAQTDEQGHFVMRVPVEGTYRVYAERMGYRATRSDPLQAGGRVSVDLLLRMPMEGLMMDPLMITAERERARAARLEREGFYARRAREAGTFMERDEIAAYGARRMSVLVSRIPGVTYVSSTGGGLAGGDVAMHRSRGCLPSVWLDGILVRPGGRQRAVREFARIPSEAAPSGVRFPGRRTHAHLEVTSTSVDDLVDVDDVEALEVYRGPGEVPAVFGGGAACGVVVVWTHTGPLSPPSGSTSPALGGGRQSIGLLP